MSFWQRELGSPKTVFQRRLPFNPLPGSRQHQSPPSVLSAPRFPPPQSGQSQCRVMFRNTDLAQALSRPGCSSGSHYTTSGRSPQFSTRSSKSCQQTLQPHLLWSSYLSSPSLGPHPRIWPPGSPLADRPFHFLLQGMGYPSSHSARLGAPGDRPGLISSGPESSPMPSQRGLIAITDHSPICLWASILHLYKVCPRSGMANSEVTYYHLHLHVHGRQRPPVSAEPTHGSRITPNSGPAATTNQSGLASEQKHCLLLREDG